MRKTAGTVIVTYWSGVVDESDLCRLGDTPYGLTELLGLRRTEIDGMYDGETRRCMPTAGCTLPEAQASTLCEVAALDEENPAQSRSACMPRTILPGTRLRRSTDTVRAVLTIWPAALMRLFIGRFITMLQRKLA